MQTTFPIDKRSEIVAARFVILDLTGPAVIYIVPGEPIRVREVASGDKPSLEQLQEFVGGYIEHVPSPWFAECYCNEEGKFKALPANEAADIFTGFERIKMASDYLAGPVIILHNFAEEDDE